MEENTEVQIREFTVQNRMGIHTRPSAQIVRLANRYPDVEISVSKDDEVVNGKSIMGLMMLAAGQGSRLKFSAAGKDAAQFLAEMDTLFSRKFDEA
ncbi:MAG: HPr family phosphocarrier protein [bacterium]